VLKNPFSTPVMKSDSARLPTLLPGEAFPDVSLAWGRDSAANGLLAAGGQLDVATLCHAYSCGIFPWYGMGQPVLWWSPDPRMTLEIAKFRLHRSLRQILQKFQADKNCEIRFDTAFEQVISACASSPRHGRSAGAHGTWIVPDMVQAYCALHKSGCAHSVETWINGQLVGGLYCVALGKAVFGESMFSLTPNASKIALAGLIGFCCHHGIQTIDCQQNTKHLAFLGASEVSRTDFLTQITAAVREPGPAWKFEPIYWERLIKPAAQDK
jgi:leucyl/phenylalanyl-tRNA---protein transferase